MYRGSPARYRALPGAALRGWGRPPPPTPPAAHINWGAAAGARSAPWTLCSLRSLLAAAVPRSHEHRRVPVPHGGGCVPAPQLLHLLLLLSAGGGRGLREAGQQVGAGLGEWDWEGGGGEPMRCPPPPPSILKRCPSGEGGAWGIAPREMWGLCWMPSKGGVHPGVWIRGGSLLTPSLSALFQCLRSQRGGHRQQD